MGADANKQSAPGLPVTDVEPIYARIGMRICVLREIRGMSQEELGRHCGLTRASISNMENGRTRLMVHVLAQIAPALDVRLIDLLGNHDNGVKPRRSRKVSP